MEKHINKSVNLKQMAIEMLKENHITYDCIGNKVYYGMDSFTIPIMIEDTIFFFKFFVDEYENDINAEIKIVEYIKSQNITIVPKYFSKENKKVFKSQKYNMVFYGTQSIDGKTNTQLNRQIVENIVINIATIHSKLKQFDMQNIDLRKSYTSERILKLFIKNNRYNDFKKINSYIEELMSVNIEYEKLYPIHADLHLGNFKIINGKVEGIIDFSNIMEASFEYDVSKFFQDIIMKDIIKINELDDLIHLYRNTSKLNTNLKCLYVNIAYNILFRYLYSNEDNNEKILLSVKELIKYANNIYQI